MAKEELRGLKLDNDVKQETVKKTSKEAEKTYHEAGKLAFDRGIAESSAADLELQEKQATIEKLRAETQKLMAPEAVDQPDPLDSAAKQADIQFKAEEMALRRDEMALKQQELALRQQELEMQERLEMARIQNEGATREQDRAHEMAMAAQKSASEPMAKDEPKPAAPDKGMESVGMGLQALAEMMGRPKTATRPDGSKITIE